MPYISIHSVPFSKCSVRTKCCIISYFFVTSNSWWKKCEKVQPWNHIIAAFYVCKDDNEWLFHHHVVIWLTALIYFTVTIKLWGEICSNSLFILAKMIAFHIFSFAVRDFFSLVLNIKVHFSAFLFIWPDSELNNKTVLSGSSKQFPTHKSN